MGPVLDLIVQLVMEPMEKVGGPCAQHGPPTQGTPDLRWGEGGQDTDTALHAAATVVYWVLLAP